ncbi:MAG: ABC transporter permease subunit [Methanomassiliicoccales archaeon]|nr:MAG: ABC transporter permease subunit [Methanomassiliicoccales archaeon]
MALGKTILDILSKRKAVKGWYIFIVVFFLLLILLPTVYVLGYVVTGWGDISTHVLSDTDSSTVEWSESEDADFLRYEIHASTDPDFYPDDSTLRIVIGPRNGEVSLNRARTTTSIIVSGLDSKEDYFFRVRVVDNSSLGLGTVSNGKSEDDGNSWHTPPPLELFLPQNESGSINLSWTISEDLDFDAYEVYYSNQTNGFVPGIGTLNETINTTYQNWTLFENLNVSEVHYFRVRVIDSDGHWSESNQQCFDFGPGPPVDCASPRPVTLEYVNSQSTLGTIVNAVVLSFVVAVVATLINFVVGLPLAWYLVRKKPRWKDSLDTLIDIPLAFPTAATGFSAALFWGITPDIMDKPIGALSLTSSPTLLLILLMVVFSFPFMVRPLASILEELDVEYETVARTCGASRFTAARTITLPMFRAGLATAVTLCLAKCISETGGVMAALAVISSREVNATALIGTWKSASVFNSSLVAGLAFLSFLLILLALLLIGIAKLIIMRAKLPIKKVWPVFERRLSRGWVPKAKDVIAFLFLILIVLLPAFYIFGYAAMPHDVELADLSGLWNSMAYSFLVAGIVTVIVLVIGVPMGILIARSKNKKIASVLDVLANIPFVVPTAALGFSLGLFWSSQDVIPVTSGVAIIIMAHIAFTYPYVVRNVVGALQQLSPEYEETARTLGAKPLQAFRRVTFPLIKMSILSGAIMTFTRSLGETGATLAVSPEAITAPVYIVSLIREGSYHIAGIASAILIVFSFIAILLLRYIIKRRG